MRDKPPSTLAFNIGIVDITTRRGDTLPPASGRLVLP